MLKGALHHENQPQNDPFSKAHRPCRWVAMHRRGNSACDVVAFVPRWDSVMHTFRPPWYHRNQATEFNGIVKMEGEYSGFMKGGSFLTPMFTAHGVASQVVREELGTSFTVCSFDF